MNSPDLSPDQQTAAAILDRLWAEARAGLLAGQVRTDPHLSDCAGDTRRGLTVILRPSPDVVATLMQEITALDGIAPGQHIYRADELHITVLTLVSAAPDFALESAPLDRYRAALEQVCAGCAPFAVRYEGLTASPDAIMAWGSSAGDVLNRLRDRLREGLSAAGLGETLDRRYRAVTTHTTLLRFRTPPPDGPALLAHLESRRHRFLGTFKAREVAFVFNDWYMAHDVVRVLARFPLGTGP